jgi:hypothetical protein
MRDLPNLLYFSPSGLRESGTIAAGEFLTDAKEMEEAVKHTPKNWRKENEEIHNRDAGHRRKIGATARHCR